MAITKSKRIAFNTTINEEIANNFREYCKTVNAPMNMVLEVFMTQFAMGQFDFKLTKSGSELVIDED